MFVSPDAEEIQYLLTTLKLDEHTLASALDPDELSRLEFEPEHIALILKSPISYTPADPYLFRVTSVGVFLFENRLIIVSRENIIPAEELRYLKAPSLKYLMLKLITRAIARFLEHLKIISTISDDLQSKINTAMENRYLLNLFSLQKSLVYYLNSINSNETLTRRLAHYDDKIGFSLSEKELLDDIRIENGQCYQQAEIYSNIAASLMDARASIVSNNLNQLMKTLNIITIGIMVPTFVVSAFSMNVRIPLSNNPNAYWVILGLAGISVAGLYLLLRHKKW